MKIITNMIAKLLNRSVKEVKPLRIAEAVLLSS